MIPFVILAIEDENDRAFMADLFISYERLLLSEAYKILQDRWEAEDVLQTTMEKLVDKIPMLRNLETRPRVNYMITAAKNTAYSALRAKGREGNMPSIDDEEWFGRNSLCSEESIERDIFRAEMLESLDRIWDELDWRSQYLLDGRYILDIPSRELAEGLGIQADSVRMELSRARRKAKKLLDELCSITEMWDQ